MSYPKQTIGLRPTRGFISDVPAHETGPDFYARAIRSFLGEHTREPLIDPASQREAGSKLIASNGLSMHAFQPWVVYPYYLGEAWVPADHPDAYAVHHWQANWEF